MAGRGNIKRVARALFGIFILLLVLYYFLPFCKFQQIITGNESEESYCKNKLNQVLFIVEGCIVRSSRYSHTLYLTKGTTYKSIPFHAEKDATDLKYADIRFNWDNTISLNFGDEKIEFEVDKVEITPETYRDTTAVETEEHFILTWMNPPTSKDSLFNAIDFYDSSGNNFSIVRQTKALVYGRQRVGFCLEMNGRFLETGRNASFFDY